MIRPLRLEFAGALYHVTSRGNGREDIFRGIWGQTTVSHEESGDGESGGTPGTTESGD